ncbi:aldolase catalytic domain-containing protein [Gilvimarinus algae]|uniref:Aldolase catalytic domain-containing protein n=1 Tax=Gilvimarinus algae TaxID=3058037 RepID=A0ABT8TJG9_9GAMM|nr:aldolase catalytic domain-containing protein [Gilvimarinus sp. SDUM040014]MDO3383233.1 aldolase catalytic domain-containing protein [Gilvimarinus sp. SDUM040014]
MMILDCTLRDGGYYNSWNFPFSVTNDYLQAMSAAGVDIVELGLRSRVNNSFKGASAYCTDQYLTTLNIPSNLKIAVMVNAAEIIGNNGEQSSLLASIFPNDASTSRVDVVRIACHAHELVEALPACNWLKSRGFTVGFNLMQVADRSQEEIEKLSLEASKHPIDVLYFADSMGSMTPAQTSKIVSWLKTHWQGAMGIHTHDNMGLALANSMQAVKDGVTWLDSTVTGMGRGPGNARTEELVIEADESRGKSVNLVPLMRIIREYFQPLKNKCGWGSNPYYYLSGKHGIHPTYIQEMLTDSRFDEEDILAAIDHLKTEGGKKFSYNALDATRHFFAGNSEGGWSPSVSIGGRDVLVIGAGPSSQEHRVAIISFIERRKPFVIALNTHSELPQELVDIRVASHPVRILADCEQHTKLPQPLVTPVSALPEDVRKFLGNKKLHDFGMQVEDNTFNCYQTRAVLPNSLVISYALAIAASGQSRGIYVAGFDGFGPGDRRTFEVQKVFNLFSEQTGLTPISITYTEYDIPVKSVYGM